MQFCADLNTLLSIQKRNMCFYRTGLNLTLLKQKISLLGGLKTDGDEISTKALIIKTGQKNTLGLYSLSSFTQSHTYSHSATGCADGRMVS